MIDNNLEELIHAVMREYLPAHAHHDAGNLNWLTGSGTLDLQGCFQILVKQCFSL